MAGRLTIRSRLVLLLMVPMLGLLGIAGWQVRQAGQQSSEASSTVSSVANDAALSGVIVALQTERAAVDQVLIAGADLMGLSQVRGLTDSAFARTGESERDEFVTADLAQGRGLANLAREGVDAGEIDPDGARDLYTDAINLAFDAMARTRASIDDQQLRELGSQLVDLELAREADTAMRSQLDALISRSTAISAAEFRTLSGLVAVRDARFNDVDVAVWSSGSVLDTLIDALRSGDESIDELASGWTATNLLAVNAIDEAINATTDRLDEVAAEASDNARRNQLITFGIAIVAVLVGLLLVIGGSRSITAPLRRLTVEASEIADERLPSAVATVLKTPHGEDVRLPEIPEVSGVGRSDEIGTVGEAIERLQSVSLDLAVEQALVRHNINDTLVSLARRTQGLVGRQLDELNELESDETDPDKLESLFRIDHLATRVRRHAESLLILAGVESTRTWSEPVPMGDVVRAALGEVEEFSRVEFGPMDQLAVHGHAVSHLSHLLAELIENALSFSPPTAPVGIVGRLRGDGYRLSICDTGIGMSDEDLARANSRLAGDELPTVAPSRYLGHYVTARLAEHLGARVVLQKAPTGGVLADVIVPLRLLDRPAGGETPSAPEDVVDRQPAVSEPEIEDAEIVDDTQTPPAGADSSPAGAPPSPAGAPPSPAGASPAGPAVSSPAGASPAGPAVSSPAGASPAGPAAGFTAPTVSAPTPKPAPAADPAADETLAPAVDGDATSLTPSGLTTRRRPGLSGLIPSGTSASADADAVSQVTAEPPPVAEPVTPTAPAGETTPGGLVKRVRGATKIEGTDVPGALADVPDPTPREADDVRSALSRWSAGIRKGRDESDQGDNR